MKQLDKTETNYWEGFNDDNGQSEFNVRDFIQQNLTQYNGVESF